MEESVSNNMRRETFSMIGKRNIRKAEMEQEKRAALIAAKKNQF